MNHSSFATDCFHLIEELTELVPVTETLYLARSPYVPDVVDDLCLYLSRELQRFHCSATGKTGSLEELQIELLMGNQTSGKP